MKIKGLLRILIIIGFCSCSDKPIIRFLKLTTAKYAFEINNNKLSIKEKREKIINNSRIIKTWTIDTQVLERKLEEHQIKEIIDIVSKINFKMKGKSYSDVKYYELKYSDNKNKYTLVLSSIDWNKSVECKSLQDYLLRIK